MAHSPTVASFCPVKVRPRPHPPPPPRTETERGAGPRAQRGGNVPTARPSGTGHGCASWSRLPGVSWSRGGPTAPRPVLREGLHPPGFLSLPGGLLCQGGPVGKERPASVGAPRTCASPAAAPQCGREGRGTPRPLPAHTQKQAALGVRPTAPDSRPPPLHRRHHARPRRWPGSTVEGTVSVGQRGQPDKGAGSRSPSKTDLRLSETRKRGQAPGAPASGPAVGVLAVRRPGRPCRGGGDRPVHGLFLRCFCVPRLDAAVPAARDVPARGGRRGALWGGAWGAWWRRPVADTGRGQGHTCFSSLEGRTPAPPPRARLTVPAPHGWRAGPRRRPGGVSRSGGAGREWSPAPSLPHGFGGLYSCSRRPDTFLFQD